MSQNAPSGLQEEYGDLRAQVLAFAGYFDSIGASGGRSWLEARGEERVTRTVIEGWREARNDFLEASRGLSGAQLRELSMHLQAECGVTLDSLQGRRLKRLADLRARGELTTDEQYRLVMTRIDELGDDRAGRAELQDLVKLITEYEEKVQRRLARQTKHRDRAV